MNRIAPIFPSRSTPIFRENWQRGATAATWLARLRSGPIAVAGDRPVLASRAGPTLARKGLESLPRDAPLILPSLLLCDFGNLQQEVRQLEGAGVQALHLDVMDGHFVPNLTYGLPIVEAVRRLTDRLLDVHLMIERPERYLEAFRQAGADVITVHAEAVAEPAATLRQIRQLGARAGIAINPQTPISVVADCGAWCDLLLIMSVPAGFGGQPFDPGALKKLRQARDFVPASCILEVDGGINPATIGACAAAGAEWFVVGSAIFRQPDYAQAVAGLTRLARQTPTEAGDVSVS